MRYLRAFLMMVGFLVEVAITREASEALPAPSPTMIPPTMSEG